MLSVDCDIFPSITYSKVNEYLHIWRAEFQWLEDNFGST